ncbi:hypothetical protein F5Y16DRAFT_401479 [Xylariaceae sp. FL0255]|nr:hypothetical protein F5Y16DRAFT_401479 [Xylariaceae sp. FL0255]
MDSTTMKCVCNFSADHAVNFHLHSDFKNPITGATPEETAKIAPVQEAVGDFFIALIKYAQGADTKGFRYAVDNNVKKKRKSAQKSIADLMSGSNGDVQAAARRLRGLYNYGTGSLLQFKNDLMAQQQDERADAMADDTESDKDSDEGEYEHLDRVAFELDNYMTGDYVKSYPPEEYPRVVKAREAIDEFEACVVELLKRKDITWFFDPEFEGNKEALRAINNLYKRAYWYVDIVIEGARFGYDEDMDEKIPRSLAKEMHENLIESWRDARGFFRDHIDDDDFINTPDPDDLGLEVDLEDPEDHESGSDDSDKDGDEVMDEGDDSDDGSDDE